MNQMKITWFSECFEQPIPSWFIYLFDTKTYTLLINRLQLNKVQCPAIIIIHSYKRDRGDWHSILITLQKYSKKSTSFSFTQHPLNTSNFKWLKWRSWWKNDTYKWSLHTAVVAVLNEKFAAGLLLKSVNFCKNGHDTVSPLFRLTDSLF